MAMFFIIKDGVVINIIEAESKELAAELNDAEAMAFEEAPEGFDIGWHEVNGEWEAPAPRV